MLDMVDKYMNHLLVNDVFWIQQKFSFLWLEEIRVINIRGELIMLKKLACIGLGVMIVITLIGAMSITKRPKLFGFKTSLCVILPSAKFV